MGIALIGKLVMVKDNYTLYGGDFKGLTGRVAGYTRYGDCLVDFGVTHIGPYILHDGNSFDVKISTNTGWYFSKKYLELVSYKEYTLEELL